ncbi:MAG: pyridoxal-dependent decarboxylase [Myxococcota bacterium]|nr:pyridoxal-dependent decarboxylase [Myxococcota bacterium]
MDTLSTPWRGDGDLVQMLSALSPSALKVAESQCTKPVARSQSPEALRETLALSLPVQGRPLEEVLAATVEVVSAAPVTAGPAFFNQLFSGRGAAAIFAEMLSGLANHSMYTFKLAGPMVIIEALLIEKMSAPVGYGQSGGVFCTGGSLSNLVAILCARDRVVPAAKEEGLPQRLRIYSSAESHYSIRKGANIAGIGRGNVVSVPVDGLGRMCPDALRVAIEADLHAGARPMMINGTAGTTVRGAFDPMQALAELAEEFGLWFHIDGAFGGSALWSPELKPLLEGAARADSFTWDAHKAMGVPLTCSVLLTRDPVSASRALREGADYLFQGDTDALNPGLRSLQCGRRNDALKLWAAWQHFGDEGWRRRLERQRGLALALAQRIEVNPALILSEPPHFLTVCFEYPGRSSASICEALQQKQRALIGYGQVKGREVIRAAVMDPQLTTADLDALVDAVIEVAVDAEPS